MISFSSTSGDSGVSVISITATSNSDINSIIKDYTLANSSGYSLPIAIAQKGKTTEEPYIVLDKNTISFPSSGGSNIITVMSNRNWRWAMDEWIGHSIDGGTTGSTLIGLRVEENTGSTRNGTISAWCMSDSAVSATTTVSQAGDYVKKDIKISPSGFTFDYAATGGTISITANTEWNIYADARWVTLSAASGSGNTAITFTITANEQSNSRNTIIYVADLNESIVRSCNLVQNGAVVSEPYLLVSPTGATVPLSGGTAVFTVSSNTEWDVYMDDVRSWVTLDNLNGYGNGEVTARVEPYNYDGTRSVDITFINERENLKSEVTITQEDIVENNKIFYTSTDGGVVSPYSANSFGGAVIVSNTYVDGQGVIEFDRDVTEIGHNAYSGKTRLETITIPRTVSVIGAGAFYKCTGLTEVNVFEGLTTIEGDVFDYCSGLTAFTIPSTVTTISGTPFSYSGLLSITIPETVINLSYNTFSHCTNMTAVTISIATIPTRLFEYNSNLKKITLGNNVSNFIIDSNNHGAFYWCNDVNTIYSYSTNPPTNLIKAFTGAEPNGVFHYPSGSNYGSVVWSYFSNWTFIDDLPAQVEESE